MKIVFAGISERPYKSYPPVSHPYWTIALNIEGSGTWYVDDKQYKFKPGTIMCFPPDTKREKVADDTFVDIFIYGDFRYFPNINKVLVFEDKDNTIETLMRLAVKFYNEKENNYKMVVNSISVLIYQMLLSWHREYSSNENIEIFKMYLNENFYNPNLKIKDVIDTTLYSESYFRRLFKSLTGLTPVEYLNNLRVEHAKHLLFQKKTSGISIANIALLSGFSDPLYFSRVFKRITGQNPQEYATSVNIELSEN